MDLQLQDLGGATFFKGNLNQKDLLKVGKVSDVFPARNIANLVRTYFCMSSVIQLRSQPLWFNSLVRVENKPIYYALWATKGIQVVSDLMVNESTFLSFSEFKDRFRFKPSFLSFLVVISAIKQLWETTNGKNLSEVSDYKTFCEKVLMANKANRILVYQKLMEKKENSS